ncbi:MAG: histidine kinase dimerization/phospho-acceptor domain-containing protein [Lachnospiraceae bacterium]
MNKWYKSAPCKGILIVIAHISVVITMVSVVWLLAVQGLNNGKISEISKEEYQQTSAFSRKIQAASREILDQINGCQNFETEGVYDENRLVDLKTYSRTGKITGEDTSGLTYRLGDLVKWSQEYVAGNVKYHESDIIVAKKLDATYDYFHYNEFKSSVQDKNLTLQGKEDAKRDDLLDQIHNSTYTEGDEPITVSDQEGAVLYQNVWKFSPMDSDDTLPEESYLMANGQTILDLVNTSPQWNGKLSEIYRYIEEMQSTLASQVTFYRENGKNWEEGNTNLAYMFVDTKKQTIRTNRVAYQDYGNLEQSIKELTTLGKYVVIQPKLVDFKSNMDINATTWVQNTEGYDKTGGNYIFALGVDTTYPIQDDFYMMNRSFEKYAPYMVGMMNACIAMGIVFLITMVWLTIVAGRTRKEGVTLTLFDRLKTEIGIIIVLVVWAIPISIIGVNLSQGFMSMPDGMISKLQIAAVAVVTCFTFAVFLWGYLSLVRRIKAHTLWKNSIMQGLGRFVRELFRNRSCTFKMFVISVAVFILQFFLMTGMGFYIAIAVIVDIAVIVFLLKQAMAKQRIKMGLRIMAAGQLDYRIQLHGLRKDDLEIAERINNIGEGLNTALEASMKNERLKTDLITNVSHDIKTPLTSIINYIDLLKRENFTDEKVLGYLEVLEAKAQRLKTLTEDVVEASKISTGSINLEFMDLNLVEMIQQTSGEFTEKFANRGLHEILNLPEEVAMIRADGRRMWRIIENIYNNVAKYAMENTRVYGDLTLTQTQVIFSLKNISEQPLNIAASELTERFIRGDMARSTEGSGLGLSIAQNLTELQGGTFELYLDGDLFRVTITFPRV